MFLKGRWCTECGSTLICKSPEFREPHCFVCGYNHPAVRYPLRGLVKDLLPRIELDERKAGMKITILPPLVTFIEGYGYLTESLQNSLTPTEHTGETQKVRDRR